ncbi:MAG: ligand-binding sensor domain-containing protein [Acidobacteriota bacterium]
MRRFTAVSILALAIAWTNHLPAQVLPFERFGTTEGVPQSQVSCVAQDAEGYLWVGTWGGLARYNGGGFTAFYIEDGLPSNRIHEILPSRGGALFVATTNGLARTEGRRIVPVPDPAVANVRCRALAEDAAGRVWVGTDRGAAVWSGGRFEMAGGQGTLGARIYDLLALPEGMLAVTSRGLLIFGGAGPREEEGPPVPHELLRCAGRTADALWVGTQGRGLWRKSGGAWSSVEATAAMDVWRVSSGGSGTLYASCNNGGLFFRRPGAVDFQRWKKENGLPSDVVSDAFEDREGNLWVGTDIGGLGRLGSLATLNFSEAAGFPSACVLGISPAGKPGEIWAGTLEGGVRFRGHPDFEILEVVTTAQGLPNNYVWEVTETPGGETWVLTDSGWRVRSRPGGRFEEPKGIEFADGAGVDMCLDGAGRLWLTGDDARGGLCLKEPAGTWRRWNRTAEGETLANCRALTPRRAGGVWVGFEGGVAVCDGATASSLPGPIPLKGFVSALLEDRRGRLWAGNDGGLAVRETDGRWRLLNGEAGFTNHHVYFLGEDAGGAVWVGTARGVFCFREGLPVQALTPEDGLAGLEANQGAFFAEPSGAVWIGTVSGLSRFEARLQPANTAPPRLVVEGAERSGGKLIPFPDEVRMRWPERGVTFRVAVLSFKSPQRCAYRARMEGIEEDWLPLRRAGDLRYTNLPPGKRNLLLQAVNESGVWGEVVRVPVEVVPSFWMTGWFRVGLLILLAGTLAAGHRWRTSLLRRRAEELEKVVADRTRALARANLDLEQLATYESLTGLFNRRAILKSLREHLEVRSGIVRRFGVLLVDLDRFKQINDTMGHAAGDQVLQVLANRIKGALREGDHMGRFGGDEFLLVLPGADLSAVESVARRVSSLSESFTSHGRTLTVTASCGGVAVAGGMPPEEAVLLAEADRLLYEVKKAGGGGFKVVERR